MTEIRRGLEILNTYYPPEKPRLVLHPDDWDSFLEREEEYWEQCERERREETAKSDRDNNRTRCPHCGRFKKKNGHCSQEIPVQGGWFWEHY